MVMNGLEGGGGGVGGVSRAAEAGTRATRTGTLSSMVVDAEFTGAALVFFFLLRFLGMMMID